MLYNVCRRSLEGMFDPTLTPRVAVIDQFTTTTASAMPQQGCERYSYRHHRNLESLRESAELGCLLCFRHKYTVDDTALGSEDDQSGRLDIKGYHRG